MKSVAITGASSFIGRHFIQIVAGRADLRIKALVMKGEPRDGLDGDNIECCQGDLLRLEALKGFIERGDTVINLAYMRDAPMDLNIKAAKNLLTLCGEAPIDRLIHFSTAVVVGKDERDVITEDCPCNPVTDYEVVKYDLEKLALEMASNEYKLVVLRPTAVVGGGGINLLKVADELCGRHWAVNYLKSCLYWKRRMNQVSVKNVVSAIEHFMDAAYLPDKAVFIVSDDEDPRNNYRDIEQLMMRELEIKEYPVPVIPLPRTLLRLLLRVRGRSCVNPNRTYDCGKLMRYGFVKRSTLEEGILDFISQYKMTKAGNGKAVR